MNSCFEGLIGINGTCLCFVESKLSFVYFAQTFILLCLAQSTERQNVWFNQRLNEQVLSVTVKLLNVNHRPHLFVTRVWIKYLFKEQYQFAWKNCQAWGWGKNTSPSGRCLGLVYWIFLPKVTKALLFVDLTSLSQFHHGQASLLAADCCLFRSPCKLVTRRNIQSDYSNWIAAWIYRCSFNVFLLASDATVYFPRR